MKLKRYVLLDNNRIYDREKLDTTNAHDYLMSNIFKAIENKEEDVCRQLVATSDEATDLIYKGDMAKHYNRRGFVETNQVYKVEYQWVKFRDETVHKDKILAIYKLIGKDYICVWERRKENE